VATNIYLPIGNTLLDACPQIGTHTSLDD